MNILKFLALSTVSLFFVFVNTKSNKKKNKKVIFDTESSEIDESEFERLRNKFYKRLLSKNKARTIQTPVNFNKEMNLYDLSAKIFNKGINRQRMWERMKIRNLSDEPRLRLLKQNLAQNIRKTLLKY